MSNENFIEELKIDISGSIDTQREDARTQLDKDLKALKEEFEKRKFKLQDKYVAEVVRLNHLENYVQMSDFFTLSDVTNALSQMISTAEGERYASHKTKILDEEGNVVKTVVSFVKESAIDGIDETISYKHSLNPECVRKEDPNYIYLCEYDDSKLAARPEVYRHADIKDTDIMVTFNPYNEFLDHRHVLARVNDPRFEYVNSFMSMATQTKMLYGFERNDDFAQMAIVHGTGLYKKNRPRSERRIKRFFSKKQ